jgi:uroporphyrinogen III methyltransferase / synthase
VVGTLESICEVVRQADIKPPALVIVGEVVKLRSTIDWFEKRALFGKRIVVTRTREQASDLVAKLEEHGAECLEYATIRISNRWTTTGFRWASPQSLSINGCFSPASMPSPTFSSDWPISVLDSRHLAGPKIAVVGRATAEELLKYGIKADLLPEQFTGEGLAKPWCKPGGRATASCCPGPCRPPNSCPRP